MNTQRNATLTVDGKNIDLPVYSGSIGPEVIEIRQLYAKTGMLTFDPGFMSTAACKSAITYIDGDAGVLLYRGYPIEQLAQNCDFSHKAAKAMAQMPQWTRPALWKSRQCLCAGGDERSLYHSDDRRTGYFG